MRSPCRARTERGAVSVEFALILPLLLLLLLGTIQYGLYFYARQGGSDIARDLVRRTSVGEDVTCAELQGRARGSVAALSASASSVAVTRSFTRLDPTLVQVGDTVSMVVAFDSYDMHLPLVPVPGNGRVSVTVQARLENVPAQPQVCS